MTPFTAPAFIRSVARFTELEVAGPRQAFSEKLGQWLHWTDAGDLAAALDADVSAGRLPRGVVADLSSEMAAFRRDTIAAIAQDFAPPSPPRRVGLKPAPAAHSMDASPTAEPADFATFHRRCLDRQQAMDAGVEALRARLRQALAATSPEMARLAALDGVMERVLGHREHGLLSAVPGALRQHFDRLRDAHREAADDLPPAEASDRPAAAEPWLAAFRADLQEVMVAELELRLQPVDGLLAALGAAPAAEAPAAVRPAAGRGPRHSRTRT